MNKQIIMTNNNEINDKNNNGGGGEGKQAETQVFIPLEKKEPRVKPSQE